MNVFVDWERVRPRKQNKIIGDAMASEGFRYLGAMDPVHYSIPKEEIDLAMDLWPMKEQLPRMTGAPAEKVYVYRVLDEISKFYTRIGRMKEVAPEILKMPDPTWIQKAAALPAR